LKKISTRIIRQKATIYSPILWLMKKCTTGDNELPKNRSLDGQINRSYIDDFFIGDKAVAQMVYVT